jgi:chromatin segregation and condensation protein Rec8/ScpA/Scc1 (kleisin family)
MSRGSRAERAITDWRLLLNPAELRRFRPWSVKLIPLIRQLAEVVRGLSITLSQAGVAIYTAAVIHREKSERIDEQEQTRRFERPDLLVPPPIEIPLRGDVLTLTLLDVVRELMGVLEKMSGGPQSGKFEQINVDIKLDDYLVKIEEEFGEFLEELMALLSSSPEFPLEELIRGLSRLEAVKRIILLLFAASRGYVDVLQDELTGKVIVRAVNGVAA